MEIGVPLLVHLHLGIFRAREGERKETSCIIERNRIEMNPIEISGEQVFSAKTSIVYIFFFFVSSLWEEEGEALGGRKKGIVFAGLAKSIKLISKGLRPCTAASFAIHCISCACSLL